jgi:hypothetical protein
MGGLPTPVQASLRAGAGVTLFMALMSYKPLIMQRMFAIGVCSGCFTLLLAFTHFLLDEVDTAFVNGLALISVCGTVLASVLAWWACVEKKDDLNMQRSVQRFHELLGELKAAEQKLRGALDTMLACSVDMDAVQLELRTAAAEGHEQLERISQHNERAITGEKRRVLDEVLLKVADLDGDMSYDAAERQRLLVLVRHMSGESTESEPRLQRLERLFAAVCDESTELDHRRMLDILARCGVFEIIMGVPEEESTARLFDERGACVDAASLARSCASTEPSISSARSSELSRPPPRLQPRTRPPPAATVAECADSVSEESSTLFAEVPIRAVTPPPPAQDAAEALRSQLPRFIGEHVPHEGVVAAAKAGRMAKETATRATGMVAAAAHQLAEAPAATRATGMMAAAAHQLTEGAAVTATVAGAVAADVRSTAAGAVQAGATATENWCNGLRGDGRRAAGGVARGARGHPTSAQSSE